MTERVNEQPTTEELIQSEIQEAAQAGRLITGESIHEDKLWHAPGVPTVYNAVKILAPSLGIVKESEQFSKTITPNGQIAYVATVKARRHTATRFGAGISSDAQVACLLGYRNAIRQLLFEE